MKKKILSVLFALVLVLTLGLVTAVPAGAADPATLLSSTGAIGTSNADTIIVTVPEGTTLGQIDSILWSVYLIQGYPPHVDIMLDGVGEAALDGVPDEALVFEYANNDPLGTDPPTYGALTDAWYQTFSDGGQGPAIIDGAAFAWLATGAPGGTPVAMPIDHADATGNQEFVLATLAQWQAGEAVNEIGAATIVLQLEIETDNYITDCVALVKDIELTIDTTTTLTANIVEAPEIIAISVLPTSINFGDLAPGDTSAGSAIIITNTGNVDVDVSTSVSGDFFIANLYLDGALATAYASGNLAPTEALEPVATVQVPLGQPAGAVTGSITIEAMASGP